MSVDLQRRFLAIDLKDVTLCISQGNRSIPLLFEVQASFPRGHFAAVMGPSGCGKSTLLKVIAGFASGLADGEILWNGENIALEGRSASEIGYVPQFNIAYDELTVGECVTYAAKLKLAGLNREAVNATVATILAEVGMTEFRNQRANVLSGGQKRRLALAMELVSKPAMLLCDEVTSGLDPQSEDEVVRLLHRLSRSDGRVVLTATHSLQHLHLFDSVLVLFKGVVAYHGPPGRLLTYFQAEYPQQIYANLNLKTPEEWMSRWKTHCAENTGETQALECQSHDPHREPIHPVERLPLNEPAIGDSPSLPPPQPSMASQFITLLSRRFLIFQRTKAQLTLHLGLIFGFPLLVANFAWHGLPSVMHLSMGLNLNLVQQMVEAKEFLTQSSRIGSLISGIVMFQVILLTLMGANNAAREIASERMIFEKEKLSGLSSLAYLGSKVAFLGFLVLSQSLWMGIFVHYICGFPGNLGLQLMFLILVNAAMTSVCLAISSFMPSAEQASLVSIYLVGFQLPLSGAVLALPPVFGTIVRPFIAAYWSWSGVLQTLKGSRYYDIVQIVVQTNLSSQLLCLWILGSHLVIGLVATWIGCQRRCLSRTP